MELNETRVISTADNAAPPLVAVNGSENPEQNGIVRGRRRQSAFPSTSYLILEALFALDKRQGSTVHDIKHYIREKYPTLPSARFGSLFQSAMEAAIEADLIRLIGKTHERLKLNRRRVEMARGKIIAKKADHYTCTYVYVDEMHITDMQVSQMAHHGNVDEIPIDERILNQEGEW